MRTSAELPKSKTVHVAFSAGPKGLMLYFNGKQIGTPSKPGGNFDHWQNGEFVLGSGNHQESGFDGSLEAIAFFTSVLSDVEINTDHQAYQKLIAKRQAPTSITLRAKLVSKSTLPTLADISPYTESLAVFDYQIESISSGMYLMNTIRVAHWSILDAAYTPLRDAKPGTIVEMTIEPFSANRQLKNRQHLRHPAIRR